MRSQAQRDETTLDIALALSWFAILPGLTACALVALHLTAGVSDQAASVAVWVATAAAAVLCVGSAALVAEAPSP